METSDEMIAWAAGFLDAEGSFTQSGGYPALAIGQVDAEPLSRFKAAMDAGNVTGPYDVAGRPGAFSIQPQYQYRLYGHAAVGRAAHAMWPHLSSPKREQARRVLTRVHLPPGSWTAAIRWERVPLAWAAGFMDGDGCFMFGQSHAAVTILQTDSEPLIRFRDTVGCGSIYGPRAQAGRLNRKPVWRFQATGLERGQAIASMLWPWLGRAKREQAERLMLLEAARRGVCHRGHRKPPRSRPCPECTRLYWARRRGDSREEATLYAGRAAGERAAS